MKQMKRIISFFLLVSIVFSSVSLAEETVPKRDEYHQVSVTYENVKDQSVDEMFWYRDLRERHAQRTI